MLQPLRPAGLPPSIGTVSSPRAVPETAAPPASGDHHVAASKASKGGAQGSVGFVGPSDVEALYAATKGRVGTDEHAVLAILARQKTPEARQALQATFQSKYGLSVEAVLKSELSLTYLKRATSLLQTGKEPTGISSWAYRAEGALDTVDALGTVFQEHPIIATLATGGALVAAHKFPAGAAIVNYALLGTAAVRVGVHEIKGALAKDETARHSHQQQSGQAMAEVVMSLPGSGRSGVALIKGGSKAATKTWQAKSGTSLLVRAYQSAKAGAAFKGPRAIVRYNAAQESALANMVASNDTSLFRRVMLTYTQKMSQEEAITTLARLGPTAGPERQAKLMALFADPAFLQLNDGERMAKVLTILGPAHTKMGQVMATSPGTPKTIAKALGKLQEGMEPMSEALLHQRMQSAGLADTYKLGEVLGVASMGQVNAATEIKTGKTVVIKFLKPGIDEASLKSEFKLMRELIEPTLKDASPVEATRMRDQLTSFEKGVLDEMDMAKEADNMKLFAKTYADHPDFKGIQFIELGKDGKALVMNMAEGTGFRKLKPGSQTAQDAAAAYIRGMADQVFKDGLFHADPHPGNVKYDPIAGKVTFLDMGAIAKVSVAEQLDLQKTVIYLLAKDPKRIAEMVVAKADKVVGPADKAKAAFIKDLQAYFDHPGFRVSALNDHLKAIDVLAQKQGIFPQSQGFWLNKSMLTAYGVFQNLSGDANVMRDMLPSVLQGLADTFRKNPASLKATVIDMARLIGTRAPTLLASLEEMKVLQPRLYSRYPADFIAALQALARSEIAADGAADKPKPVVGSLKP
jgi:ubiquinone biosynthesis protein